MASHDLNQSCSVWRAAGSCIDRLGALAEILSTYRRWRDNAERLYILASIVIEPVNGASRNTQRLPRPDLDLLSIDSPRQYSIDTVYRLLVMIVAVR